MQRGVFDATSTLFERYRARMVFRDKLVGRVHRDPKLIEGWLRSPAGIEDTQQIRQAMIRTLAEPGVDVQADMSFEQLEQAAEVLAARKQTTGFKVDERGLYIEGRQVKAMPTESTNTLFGGERWGATRKGPKWFLAERVFIQPDRLWLGVREPSGVELMIGHVSGAHGPAQHRRFFRRTAPESASAGREPRVERLAHARPGTIASTRPSAGTSAGGRA